MDYITQELLRQKVALTALLSGPQSKPEEKRDPAEEHRAISAGDGAERQMSRYAVTAGGGDEAVTADRSVEIAADVSAQTLQQMLDSRSAANRAALTGTMETEVFQRGAALGGATSGGGRRRVGDSAEESGNAAVRQTQAPGRASYAAFAVESVRDISRTVERDARRYDGGYALY